MTPDYSTERKLRTVGDLVARLKRPLELDAYYIVGVQGAEIQMQARIFNQLKDERNEACLVLLSLQEEVARLTEDLRLAVMSDSAECVELNRMCNRHQKAHAQLQATLDRKQKDIDDYAASLDQYCAENKELKRRIEHLQAEREENWQKYVDANEALIDTQARITELEREINHLR